MRSMLAEIQAGLPSTAPGGAMFLPCDTKDGVMAACLRVEGDADVYTGNCPACIVALHAEAMRNPHERFMERSNAETVNELILSCGLPLPLVPK